MPNIQARRLFLILLAVAYICHAKTVVDDSLLKRLLSKVVEREEEVPPSPKVDVGKPLETDGGSDDEEREFDDPIENGQKMLAEETDLPLDTSRKGFGTPQAIRRFDFYDNGTLVSKTIGRLSVDAHNVVRQQHKNTPNVRWDSDMAAQAEEFALELASSDTLYHSTPAGSSDGENLFSAMNAIKAKNTPAEAVYRWYRESWIPVNYDYSRNAFSDITGHFTQVVWKSTSKIGCGAAASSWADGPFTWTRIVYVCRYGDGGNSGEYTDNVQPLKSGAAVSKPPLHTLYTGNPGCVDLSNIMCKPSWCGVVDMSCGCTCPDTNN